MNERPNVEAARKGEGTNTPGVTLFELALAFLKIGCIGFGGGMATIALMEQELVRRRLLDSEEFVHGVGLGQVLGPFAVNASIFIGYRLYGLAGGLLCAGAFLAPSVLLVTGLSWLYFTYHSIPALQGAMAGLGPVVIALILGAAWSMGRKALRAWPAWAVAALALGASLLKTNPVYTLVAAGAIGLLLGKARLARGEGSGRQPKAAPTRPGPGGRPGITPLAIGVPVTAAAGSLGGMAAAFFKIAGLALALLTRLHWHPAFVLALGALLGALRWIP